MDIIFNLLKYIVLGFVQGIIEPLPVSSKGHVTIAMDLLGISMTAGQRALFLAFIHLGSLAAFAMIYYETISNSLTGTYQYFFKQNMRAKKEAHLFLNVMFAFLIFATIIFVFDTLFNVTDTLFSGNPIIVALGLLITAAFLVYIEFGFNPKKQTKPVSKMTFRNAIIIGLFQVFAIIPGVTRSGSTLLGGMSQRLKKTEALNFSFLLFIPTILVANLFTMVKYIKNLDISNIPFYIVALISAFFATFVGYRLIRFILKHNALRYFAVYAIVMAIAIFIFKDTISNYYGDTKIIHLTI